jgi:hypothetical protein
MSMRKAYDAKKPADGKSAGVAPTRTQGLLGRQQIGAKAGVKASHGDESDYSDDWGADSP